MEMFKELLATPGNAEQMQTLPSFQSYVTYLVCQKEEYERQNILLRQQVQLQCTQLQTYESFLDKVNKSMGSDYGCDELDLLITRIKALHVGNTSFVYSPSEPVQTKHLTPKASTSSMICMEQGTKLFSQQIRTCIKNGGFILDRSRLRLSRFTLVLRYLPDCEVFVGSHFKQLRKEEIRNLDIVKQRKIIALVSGKQFTYSIDEDEVENEIMTVLTE